MTDVQAMINQAVAAAVSAQARAFPAQADVAAVNPARVLPAMQSPALGVAVRRTWEEKIDTDINHETNIKEWLARLERHVLPFNGSGGMLGEMPVGMIYGRHIRELLEWLWRDVSANQAIIIRAALSQTFKDCMGKEEMEFNPAGEAQAALVKRIRASIEKKPQEFVKPADVGKLLKVIREGHRREGRGGRVHKFTQRLLEFLLLTGVRSHAVLEMTWEQVDMVDRVWTIPKSKTMLNHRVPLSRQAMRVLQNVARSGQEGFVFSWDDGRPLHRSTPSSYLKNQLDGESIATTPHRFRTTFRTWCQEHGKQFEAGESSLGHKVGGQVERTYARADYLDERRELMQEWADYVTAAGKAEGSLVAL
jgi:integrase